MADTNNIPLLPDNNKEKIAMVVTYVVISLTAIIAIGAIIIISISNNTEELNKKFTNYKDVIAILLPLWGTWIGTVLAYYFSKDNFESANKSVQNLVNSMTSEKKLESTKAKDIMIPLEKLIYQLYKSGTDDTTINLKKDFLNFINSNNIQRVILLDENKCAKYVLHKSTIEGFISDQYFNLQDKALPLTADTLVPQAEDAPASKAENTPAPQTLTFTDLKTNGDKNIQAILKDGVKFIKEDANLSDAKVLIKNYAACNDVFITKNGLETEPVLGWITDKTIAENSIV